jgi:hypothetical protein
LISLGRSINGAINRPEPSGEDVANQNLCQDRYGGSYSGGGWVAVQMDNKTMEISDIENGILEMLKLGSFGSR